MSGDIVNTLHGGREPRELASVEPGGSGPGLSAPGDLNSPVFHPDARYCGRDLIISSQIRII